MNPLWLPAALVSRAAPAPAASEVPAQLRIGVTVLFPLAVRQGVKLEPPITQCVSPTVLLVKLSVKIGVPAACTIVGPTVERPTTEMLRPSRTISARRADVDNRGASGR
jgi:hypothetical protein